MRVELTTSGGLTGRGLGSVVIEGRRAIIDGKVSSQITDAEEARLSRLPIVRSTRSPRGSADAVSYTLVIDGHRWTWTDAAPPSDCSRWAEVLLAIRERALAQPSSSM